jgi:glycosyltransferase involved in cell wall biosynthesis
MKVAIVTKTFPPFSYGGTETYSEQLATELSKQQGVEVHVICFQSAPVPVKEEEVARYRESHPFTMHIAGVHSKEKRAIPDARRMMATRKRIDGLIREIRPDIIQTIGVYSEALMGVWSGNALGVPTVVFPRGSDVQGPSGSKISHFMVKTAIQQTTLVMCQTQWMRERLVAWKYLSPSEVDTRSIVVYNAISLSEESDRSFHHSASERQININQIEPPTILWIGRFEAVKQPATAVDYFRRILPQLPKGSKLLMIGKGSQLDAVREQVGEEPSIELTGRLKPEEIADHLRKASLLINTSSSEGFPQTFLEAMVHGVPIVCFNVAANAEIVEQGVNGYVVDPGDGKAFGTAIERILTDRGERERMKSANLETVKCYSWDTILPKILDAYQTLISAERMKPEKKGWFSNTPPRTRK